MPSQTNIIVKKKDGATNVTYVAKQPSSGDGVAAVWKLEGVGTAYNHQPELRCSARQIGGGKREVTWSYHYPSLSTNTTTGLTSVVYKEQARSISILDPNAPQTDIGEAVYQFANLMASPEAKAITEGMNGPT